ncbi:relaxase [Photobacterium frigidiphilum]|uniref:Relaxase n=1 Tax=Photobacterium frigidiphilum TaxID=264736 RepID=A0A2T3J6X2_9GAMM|nr:MobH family relaxase [Photobacterium frigidiphilum]PSU44269.1 relaxase [Photobacterium frigidiphilum]
MKNPITSFFRWLNDDNNTKPPATVAFKETIVADGFILPWTKEQFRNDTVIQDKLRVLKRSGLALPYEVWEEFVVDTVLALSMWMQAFPASENYHHAYKRGLLEHSLDVAIYAMRLRRNYILPPNTPPEEVLHREYIWVYGVFLSALLHDTGKIVDFWVEIKTSNDESEWWTPAHGALGELGAPYRFKYKDDRAYSTHQHLGTFLLNQLVPKNPMTAIMSDSELFAQMTGYLSGHKDADNVIEQIVRQADAASVAQDLGANKDGVNLAAKQARVGASSSFAEQLTVTLRYLLTEKKILLNRKGAEGFVDGEYLYLICKPIADKLRTTLLERGVTNVPSKNTKLFNELQTHNIIRPNTQGLAVWQCEIVLSDLEWRQNFTCICIHLPTFLPEHTLKQMPGTVTLTEPDETETDSVNETISEQAAPEQNLSPEQAIDPAPEPNNVALDLMAFMPGFETTEEQPASVGNVTEAVAEKSDFNTLTPKDIGEQFWAWVEQGLLGGVYPVNTELAFYHIVNGHVFIVSPCAFKTFVESYRVGCDGESYAKVQNGFQLLNKHKKNGVRNFQTVRVNDESILHGYLVEMNDALFAIYPTNNPLLTLEGDEGE